MHLALKWKCLEPVTAIGCCWGAYAFGMLDGGITVGAIIGGSKLMQLWGEAKQTFGLGNSALLKRHQKAIRQRWEAKARGDWVKEADLNAADERLASHLLEAIPPAKDLGLTIVDNQPYPTKAARMIVDRLALRDDCRIFRMEGEEGSSRTARIFALEVLEASLEAALAEPEYAQKLFPWFLADIGRGVARLEKKLDEGLGLQAKHTKALRENDEKIFERMVRIEKLLEGHVEIPSSVLRETIISELEALPGSTDGELAQAVIAFKLRHDRLLAQVRRIKTFDNRIASIKASAQEALEEYDHALAARLYRNARQLLNARTAERARESAEFADAEAQALLLEGDWPEATSVWLSASEKLRPFDVTAAGMIAVQCATELFYRGLRLDGGELEAADAVLADLIKLESTHSHPFLKATVYSDRGLVLSRLGQRSDDGERVGYIEDALTHLTEAEGAIRKEDFPLLWAECRNRHGSALAIGGHDEAGEKAIKRCEEAIDAFRDAREVFAKEGEDLLVMSARNNTSGVLAMLALLKNSAKIMSEAVDEARIACNFFTENGNQIEGADGEENIAILLQCRAAMEPTEIAIKTLEKALEHAEKAAHIFEKEGATFNCAKARETHARISTDLREHLDE